MARFNENRETWDVTFSAVHLRVTFEEKGETKEQLFELYRTRPVNVFHRTNWVNDKSGREWTLGMIRPQGDQPERWAAWPA